MNQKIFFALIFGIPTLILIKIYHDFGVNNLWQLFLFGWATVFGYLPGIIIYIYHIKKILKSAIMED